MLLILLLSLLGVDIKLAGLQFGIALEDHVEASHQLAEQV